MAAYTGSVLFGLCVYVALLEGEGEARGGMYKESWIG